MRASLRCMLAERLGGLGQSPCLICLPSMRLLTGLDASSIKFEYGMHGKLRAQHCAILHVLHDSCWAAELGWIEAFFGSSSGCAALQFQRVAFWGGCHSFLPSIAAPPWTLLHWQRWGHSFCSRPSSRSQDVMLAKRPLNDAKLQSHVESWTMEPWRTPGCACRC